MSMGFVFVLRKTPWIFFFFLKKIAPTTFKAQFKSPTNPQGSHRSVTAETLASWPGLSFAAPLEPAHGTPPSPSVLTLITLPLPRLRRSKAPHSGFEIPPPVLTHLSLFSLLVYPPCPLLPSSPGNLIGSL